MPKFKLEMLFYTMFAIGFSLIIGSNLTHCQSEPISTSGQPSLPAQDNFEHEKIWTDEDFKNAEIDPLDVDYLTAQELPPDFITAEDKRLISENHNQRLKQFLAKGRE